jgi:uncharacterized protein with HEPN domain
VPRDSSVYLEDIVTAAERIASYVAGHTRESFASDAKTVDAVVRNLEIVGEEGIYPEAARRMKSACRSGWSCFIRRRA